MSAAVDPYATAKANLRDNVKTLVAVFGAVAGILLAGTPFSAFGTLQGSRLGLAFAALVGAVVLLGWALKILLEILTPTLAYARWLRDDFAVASLTDPDERKDVPELIREFRRSRAALLPDESGPRGTIASIEDLVSAINFYWQHAQIAAAPAVSEQAQLSAEQNRAFWQIYFDALSDINHWAGFIRFHHRIRIGIDKVLGVGFLALLCIALFAWATGAPKSEVASRGTVIIGETRGPAPVAKGEPLEPILFKTGKYKLSKDAADRIGEARDRLRQHSEEGLIIYAYTDTQGSDSFNSLLAQNRAKAVVHALLGTGGIAASRVFVSELSITDLPVLTLPNTDEANNRSVFLATVQLPRRWRLKRLKVQARASRRIPVRPRIVKVAVHLALVLWMAIPFPYFMSAAANIFTVPKLRDNGAMLGYWSSISGMLCVLFRGLFSGLLLPMSAEHTDV